MATLTLDTAQIVDLVRQLPPEEKREVLLLLAEEGTHLRQIRAQQAEAQLRYQASIRGFIWETMNDEQRELLIDDLVHEARV